MTARDIEGALSSLIGTVLSRDLVRSFLEVRQDLATRTLGRSSPGKFVETIVQGLQFIETASFDRKPNVDEYLRDLESRQSVLDDGLRICGCRVARSMYALRNKRNIAHKGEIDPNTADLSYLYSAAQWLMAELVRRCVGVSMEAAARLVDQIEAPVSSLVEDYGVRRLVLADLSATDEVLVLLESAYPDSVSMEFIVNSVDRRCESTVRKAVSRLWKKRMIDATAGKHFRLTQRGYTQALHIISRLAAQPAETAVS